MLNYNNIPWKNLLIRHVLQDSNYIQVIKNALIKQHHEMILMKQNLKNIIFS